MKHFIVLAFLATVVSCTGSGTETDNPATPLKSFSSSACKTKGLGEGQQALVRESDADGLTCVEWTRQPGGALELQLYNIAEPCGEYLGTAATGTDGSVELTVYKDTCDVFRCGTCVFDFHYELNNVPADEPLRLRIGSAVCESKPTTVTDELVLPIDSQDTGILCRSQDRSGLEAVARSRGSCGAANMPCGQPCDSADRETCGAGLTCTELAPSDSRCLTDCEADADCSSGLTTCSNGVCQAPASW